MSGELEIPAEVMAAAQAVNQWMELNGLTELGPVCSRRIIGENKSLLTFAGAILKAHRPQSDMVGDVGGDLIQEAAARCGLLDEKTVTESCGPRCVCADVGFPNQCFFLSALGEKAIAAGKT